MMKEHKMYINGMKYLERIRQVVGEELWDKTMEELKNGRKVYTENNTALRNSV